MKKIVCFISVLMVLTFVSCEKDLIVKDITNETVLPLTPQDGYTTPNNNITFWWEKVDGAEKYNIQIVSPSFNTIQQLITDTNVTGDKFTRILQPGSYQWRIRAVNNGGNTAWTTRTLTIDTSSNLSYAGVILASPADSVYTNLLTHTFSWYAVNNATSYNFNVISLPATSVYNTNTTNTNASLIFSAEGTYKWQVRAENSFSISPYSSRVLIIDQTAPNSPVLSYPASSITPISSDTSLRWITPTDSYKDILLVSDTASFSTTIKLDTVVNINGTTRTYLISDIGLLATGTTYYWKVKSMDKAKNVGNYSSARFFRVQ